MSGNAQLYEGIVLDGPLTGGHLASPHDTWEDVHEPDGTYYPLRHVLIMARADGSDAWRSHGFWVTRGIARDVRAEYVMERLKRHASELRMYRDHGPESIEGQ